MRRSQKLPEAAFVCEELVVHGITRAVDITNEEVISFVEELNA